ncbi:phage antirepressor KilAC domain-containing protein [Thomasclavelia cocleata]|uniref:phage antirepressor KilAC domain-containing protein n=1 Tax=Thomasclavelia cocleata TaxID=69824 RepID=UPI0024940FF9|nr:phage antirepressor KilAC domain-containing protein [Thomasclavelia cocleata]
MNELLKVNCDNERITLSVRQLHEFLEIKTKYKDWFPRMCEYGFNENVDYRLVAQKKETNNPKNPFTTINDHEITLDMAKEIAMLQRSEKGKQARQYFIELEKKWNSPEQIMARAILLSNSKIEHLTLENEQLKEKALFADAVSASPDSIYIGDLAKLLKQNGINIGQNRLFLILRNEGYLIKRECMRNEPTQRSLELGIMELVESTWEYSGGLKRINKTTFITGKGQIYFINKFLNKTDSINQLSLWEF